MLKCHCPTQQAIPAHRASCGNTWCPGGIQGTVPSQGNLLKIFCGGGRVPEEIWPKKAPCGTHLLETVEWVEKREGNEAKISLEDSCPGRTRQQRACDI